MILLSVLSGFMFVATAQSSALPLPPRLILWAWERPEDLHFIDPLKVEVAALVQTVLLSGDATKIQRRQQRLLLPAGTKTIAVTRLETDRRGGAKLTVEQRTQVAAAIVSSCRGARGVQIDFDARVSERDFYLRLLRQVRAQLPSGKTLSITSLASWCFFDDWLGSDSPADEIVPMFFCMGAGKREVLDLLKRNRFLRQPYRRALGVSVSEPDTGSVLNWAMQNQPGSSIYFFNSKPWTSESVNEAVTMVSSRKP